MPDEPSLHFGQFEIRPQRRQLRVDGRAAALGSRAFDLLLAFAASPGRLLTKNELLDLVWPNLVVEENNLQVQISTLRKLLGADVIATIPGRGYRFTAVPVSAEGHAVENAAAKALEPAVEAAAGRLATAPAPAGEAAAPLLKTNLPARLPALIGRDDDLLTLDALLQEHALVSVVGAGGIGKTLLAQHVLDRHRGRHLHGVCFVELANLSDPAQVVGTVAAAIGVQTGGGGDPLEALVQAVAPLTLLIALDNAEHLLDEVGRVAAALHAGAPRVTLLITSQASLQLNAEHVYRVGTLSLPEDGIVVGSDQALRYGALALFAERARQVDRRFTLDDGNVATAVLLCRRLDGLPLAIGLAAARVPMLGLEKLAAALGERLRLLTSGGRDAASRHRTLRAALEWSHGLLDEREQILFRRLGVVVGSASLELVREIAADADLDEWAAFDALSVLVERSLVMLDPGGDEAEPRYRLLESPRAYAVEKLAAAGETEALRERHARALATQWAAAFEAYYGTRLHIDAWRHAVMLDLENGRAAFAWAQAHDPVVAAHVATVLAMVLVFDPPSHRALCDAVEPLLHDERVPPLLRAQVWVECARDLPLRRSVEWTTRALALYRATGDERGCFLALADLAWANGLGGDVDAAGGAVAEMPSVLPVPMTPALAIREAYAHAALALAREHWDDVLRHFRRASEIGAAAGGSDIFSLLNVVEAELVAGHVDEAVREGEALMARVRGARDSMQLTRLRMLLVAAWLARDGAAQARAHAMQAWPQAEAVALHAQLADHCALLATLEGRPRAAAALVGYADAAYAAQRDVRQVTEAKSVDRALAAAQAVLGEAELARRRADGAALDATAAARAALAERDRDG